MAAAIQPQAPFGTQPSEGSDKGANSAHTRTYQACIPCRRRKVRCDLGPVDNPHDPPCVRCRREAKECFFSATRRKKRTADSGGDDEDVEPEDYEVYAGRKRLKSEAGGSGGGGNGGGAPWSASSMSPAFSAQPLTPGGSVGRTAPLRRPTATRQSMKAEDEDQVNSTTAILQTAEVHSGHDALNVLLEAATHHRSGSGTSTRPTGLERYSSHSGATVDSPMLNRGHSSGAGYSVAHGGSFHRPSIDPALMQDNISQQDPELNQALLAWSRFRFVRAGWFSAREGIAYVEYFYRYLSPLTPVCLPDYRALSSHTKLLTEEPMLAVTILLVASRHMKLEGPGAVTRPYFVHSRLWNHLQGMIDRVVWGQEQFGSKSNGIGGQPGCDVSPTARKGLRTLGTIESMMLLTEWHPRAMHFPPDDDDKDLMLPDEPVNPIKSGIDDANKGFGGHSLEDWLEPCWRSDRICWMLLGMATSLAFEIGVFDSNPSRHFADSTSGATEEQKQYYEQRRKNVRDLLLVYISQTSGRLGLTSMLPPDYCEPRTSENYGVSPTSIPGTREQVIHFWLRMAEMTKIGNRNLFPNRQYTRDLIKSGEYRNQLTQLQGPLLQWRSDFDACHNIPNHMRHILIIEYNYNRVYLNSLALQAVVERCTNNAPAQGYAQTAQSSKGDVPNAKGTGSDNAIAPSVLERWYGHDRRFVHEVILASRELLASVVEGLVPGEYLKHAPVRTYFRIISVSMILLKTFALGATEKEVEKSLSLLDRTVDALRTRIVDDVHISSRYADLLETLTNRIRSRMIRMGTNGSSRNQSRGVSPSPVLPQGTQGYMTQTQTQNQNQNQNQQDATTGAVSHTGAQWQGQGQYGQSSASPYMTGRSTPSHPLHGISTTAYDFSDNGNAFSVMPPPTNPGSPSLQHGNSFVGMNSGGATYGGYGVDGAMSDGSGNMPDWLALPLDPLLNSFGDVTQTGYGPGVGEYDMLELLLNGNGNQG